MRVARPGDRQRGKVLRGMRTRVGSGFHQDFSKALECRTDSRRMQRAAGELGAKKFQNDVFRQPQQVRKRLLAVARSILRDGVEQHAHALAAGFLHGTVNGARRFFGSKAARGLERRCKARQQPQRGHRVVRVRRFDRRFRGFPGSMAAIGDQGTNQACQHRVHFAVGLRIDRNAFHTILQEAGGPPSISGSACGLF